MMIQFQGGKYCDIKIRHHPEKSYIGDYLVRIRDTGDTHLDIACNDLSHALELWTAIERSPEVKLVVNMNDYIVKGDKECHFLVQNNLGENKCNHKLAPVPGYSDCVGYENCHIYTDEFADCKHRPITKEDCKPGEFDLEEMA